MLFNFFDKFYRVLYSFIVLMCSHFDTLCSYYHLYRNSEYFVFVWCGVVGVSDCLFQRSGLDPSETKHK